MPAEWYQPPLPDYDPPPPAWAREPEPDVESEEVYEPPAPSLFVLRELDEAEVEHVDDEEPGGLHDHAGDA